MRWVAVGAAAGGDLEPWKASTTHGATQRTVKSERVAAVQAWAGAVAHVAARFADGSDDWRQEGAEAGRAQGVNVADPSVQVRRTPDQSEAVAREWSHTSKATDE
ncbi:hypothetical protein FGB62_267g03 [Gracilaria domingensis]|nr:hypothetical protein FGB62_267g03 [Gracilaria domingensis]